MDTLLVIEETLDNRRLLIINHVMPFFIFDVLKCKKWTLAR